MNEEANERLKRKASRRMFLIGMNGFFLVLIVALSLFVDANGRILGMNSTVSIATAVIVFTAAFAAAIMLTVSGHGLVRGCGVTLAGECIDRSEIGNFVYGSVARYFRMTWIQTWGGSIAGNRGKRTDADAAGVSLGYDYGGAGGNLAAFLKGKANKLKEMGGDAPDVCKPCPESVANIPAHHVTLPKVDKHNAEIALPGFVNDDLNGTGLPPTE